MVKRFMHTILTSTIGVIQGQFVKQNSFIHTKLKSKRGFLKALLTLWKTSEKQKYILNIGRLKAKVRLKGKIRYCEPGGRL